MNLQDVAGSSALMAASSEGHVEIARLLLRAGADMNLQDAIGNSALMLASNFGHVETARLLLHARANTSLRDIHGQTACMHASEPRLFSIIRFLLLLLSCFLFWVPYYR